MSTGNDCFSPESVIRLYESESRRIIIAETRCAADIIGDQISAATAGKRAEVRQIEAGRRGGEMSWLRHMRTTQERRRWFADAMDVVLRRSRGPHSLRSLWDDVWRKPRRSWKEHRKTKYKLPRNSE
jgi:hypothetical protein